MLQKQKFSLYFYIQLLIMTICFWVVLLMFDLSIGYDKDFGFRLLGQHFYKKPFEDCRIITNHVYKDIYYGGFINWLAWFGWYFFKMVVALSFAFPLYFIIGIRILEKYYIKFRTPEEEYDYDKSPVKWNIFGLIYLILIVWLYDLSVYYISSLYFGDAYNCFDIIKSVEKYYEFNK